MNWGSFFFAEIVRITSSLKPAAMASVATFVVKPYLYSVLTNSSIVLVDSLIKIPDSEANSVRLLRGAIWADAADGGFNVGGFEAIGQFELRFRILRGIDVEQMPAIITIKMAMLPHV